MREEYEFWSTEKDNIEQQEYLRELIDNDAISHNEELYMFGYNQE